MQVGPTIVREHSIVLSTRSIDIPSVEGVAHYYIPIDDFVLNQAGESSLELDQGGGFVAVPYESGYNYITRLTCDPSVVDAAIGFAYVGEVSAGWTFRFKWYTRTLFVPPPRISPVRIVGGNVDFSDRWHMYDAATCPNGIHVRELHGYQVELWRYTQQTMGGGMRQGGPRYGRRYVPYRRFPTNQFLIDLTDLGNSRRRKFRVCYYDPATGARSELSNTAYRASNKKDDVSGQSGPASNRLRVTGAVWVD